MKRILVTGGAGFIGSALIARLKKAGYNDISVIDNLSFGRRKLADVADNRFFQVDLRDKEDLSQAIQEIQPQWVYHLAAIHFIPYCNQNPGEAWEVNVEGTANLFRAMGLTKSVEKVFFASTAAVYGLIEEPIAESDKVDPQDIYGKSKLEGEKMMTRFGEDSGVPVVNCRFFNAFGPNETNPHLIPEIQKQINSGQRKIKLGNLDPRRDFIHTEDMSRALVMLMEHELSNVVTVNLGQGKSYSVREVVAAFEKALGEQIEIEQDAGRVRKSDRPNLQANISRISQLIDWKPRWTLTEGVQTLLTSNAVS